MKTDSLFYRLFQTFPPLLFDLLKYTPATANYSFKSVEIKQTAFRLDGVFSPPTDDHNSPLFFVEVQFQADKLFYHRFFSEIFLYLRQFDPPNPWQGVVIYPNRQTETGKTFHYDLLLASSRVSRIYLDELEPLANDPFSLRLLKLIVTPADKSVVFAQQIAKQTYGQISQKQLQLQLIDLLETIMVYKLPTLSKEEIQRMIGLTDVDLKQTRFYQDVFTEGRTEGKQEEGVNIVLRLLRRRFGSLDSAIEARIQGLKLSVIEVLVEQLLDFTDISELEIWLENQ